MHGVAPLGPGMKMAGPAFTLRYIPAREDLNAGEVDNLVDVQRIGIEQIDRDEVQGGASIVGTYPPDEKTLAEFAEWKKRRS